MDFKKITISLPKALYDEAMSLVNKGFFSNFSDLVRSGIRSEFKDLKPISNDFNENSIYEDALLMKGVKQSVMEAHQGKGKVLKSDKEMDEYFNSL